MRIVAGTHGGRRLRAPAGTATRPTPDRVREAVFAILGPLEGLDVLDLFAGSGAMGLEALSRGASSAVLVDRDPRAAACARENAASLGLLDRVRVVRADWRSALAAERGAARRYGLVVIDPPYRLTDRVVRQAWTLLAPVLTSSGTVVIEHTAHRTPPDPEELAIASRTDRAYGDTAVRVIRLGGAS